MSVMSNKFHPNSQVNWKFHANLCDSNGGHNNLCKIDSKSCSTEMSPYDLCLWHYYRIASYHELACGCGTEKFFCSGDATSRKLFRDYYDCWKIPVQDLTNKIYCCGTCQNRDSETHYCGDYLIGACCLAKHPGAKMLDKSEDFDDLIFKKMI